MVNLIDINNNNTISIYYIIKFLHVNLCFTPDLKQYPIKTPRHEPSVIPKVENKYNMLVLLPPKQHVNKGLANYGSLTSESHEFPVKEIFFNTYKIGKILLKIHPMSPSENHLAREKRGLQSTKQYPKFPILSIWYQLVFSSLLVCTINPNKPMVYLIYSQFQ